MIDTQVLRSAAAKLRSAGSQASAAGVAIPAEIPTDMWDEGPRFSSYLQGWRSEYVTDAGVLNSGAAVLDWLAAFLDERQHELALALHKERDELEDAASASVLNPLAVIDDAQALNATYHRMQVEGDIKLGVALAGDSLKDLAHKARRSEATGFHVSGIPWGHRFMQSLHDTSPWDAAKGVTTGLWHWGSGLVVGGLDLAWHENSIYQTLNPDGYREYNENLAKGLWQFGSDLWNHPGDTLYATLKLDLLADNPSQWVGEVGPDVVLTVIAGTGLATKGMEMLRGAEAIEAARGAETAEGLRGLSAAVEAGPGGFVEATESMSARAAAYQAEVTGAAPGTVYRVGGVDFDGFANGSLLEAKGPGYANFVRSGQFQPWFQGADDLVSQASRQLLAAGGSPIQWFVAESEAATAIRNLLAQNGITGIDVVWRSP
jgi:hypothetical protein